MAIEFDVNEAKKTKIKRLKFLPRVGIYIDFAGKEFTFKHVPVLETLLNLTEKDLNLQSLMKMSMQQLAEIKFSKKETAKTIDASAKTISVEQKRKKVRGYK